MRRTVAFLLMPALLAGCGYTLRPPYDPTIRTVYVPTFKSVSFRRDLNLMLTELVQKEIDRRSMFKVVGSADAADSILEGTIIYSDKNIMVENPNNLPRELLAMMTIEVRWLDNRSGDLEAQRKKPPVRVIENVPFFPEVGETVQLGYQKALERIARDIVNMMEEPW